MKVFNVIAGITAVMWLLVFIGHCFGYKVSSVTVGAAMINSIILYIGLAFAKATEKSE